MLESVPKSMKVTRHPSQKSKQVCELMHSDQTLLSLFTSVCTGLADEEYPTHGIPQFSEVLDDSSDSCVSVSSVACDESYKVS